MMNACDGSGITDIKLHPTDHDFKEKEKEKRKKKHHPAALEPKKKICCPASTTAPKLRTVTNILLSKSSYNPFRTAVLFWGQMT